MAFRATVDPHITVEQADIQASISSDERSLYAALTCDLPTLLPTCNTWEDHLWARALSRIEARLESRWRDLGGFWEQDARTSGAAGQDDADESQQSGGASGMDGLIDQMAQVQDVRVRWVTCTAYFGQLTRGGMWMS